MLYPSMFNDKFYNDLFDEALNFPFDYGKRVRNEIADKKRCTTDIKEFEDRYELDMEFPGFNKEDIKAELKNGYLIVSAEHTETKEEGAEDADKEKTEEPKYLRRERFYGKTERSFFVGKDVSKEDIKAKFLNGVLTLQIPKVPVSVEKPSEMIDIME